MLFHVNHLGFRRLKQIILKLPKSRIVSGRGHRRCAAKGSRGHRLCVNPLWKPHFVDRIQVDNPKVNLHLAPTETHIAGAGNITVVKSGGVHAFAPGGLE